MRVARGGDGIGESAETYTATAIMPLLRHPSRYVDGELHLANRGFREGFFNVLLVFPDVYEIGMSHQGIQFLYHRLAGVEHVGVELAFAPWLDAEKLARATEEPLRSLRTGTPAGRFDVIGISMTYELQYTNALMVLDLAGLSLEAAGRGEEAPLVIAGGPCCSNPLPFMNAFDAIFLGDGEQSLPEAVEALAKLKGAKVPRRERIEALARIEGVFVPGITSTVRARTYRFQSGDLPRRPIVPSSEVVHQRLSLEIMRGCARGCRFCHAGIFYRPCRERSVGEIVDAALAGLDATGWDEVSLLSLSTSDYSRLGELCAALVPELERRKVSLALPSLRPETITNELVAASAIVTRSGFTLAPEAGTERLRRAIGKDFGDDEILDGVKKILAGGWQVLKLYFMIGLPTEREEDLAGIADLIGRILALPRRGGRFKLNVSISPFVPKAHTPFQWERQCSVEELREKEDYLASRIRNRFVTLSQRDPRTSVLEGILARGDERIWPVLRRAYELGCRFDSWTDELKFDLWERALGECGLAVGELIGARSLDAVLPWNVFELHATGNFLLKEREKAYAAETAPAPGRESDGGAGGAPAERAPRSQAQAPPPAAQAARAASPPPGPGVRYRFIFEKAGRARFLSHIETMNVIQRALRRSKLPLNFTEGFHPHPRISAGPSLAVGMEGMREFFDVELREPADVSPEILNACLPEGIGVRACTGPFSRKAGKLPPEARFTYLLSFDALKAILATAFGRPPAGRDRGHSGTPSEPLSENERMWYLLGKELGLPGAFASTECGAPVDPAALLLAEWGRMFERGVSFDDEAGKSRSCAGCSVRSIETGPLELVLPGAEGAPRPHDLVRTVLPKELASLVRIRRLDILYKGETGFVDPLQLIESRRRET